MPQTPSPLRYPGGKSSLLPMVSRIIQSNNLEKGHYAEPYAGGGGLALSLLMKGYVEEIHLNDLDRSIWAFWDAIINETDRFIDKIRSTSVTIEEWYYQRNIQVNSLSSNNFDLGFSSFFLNRTNRSGIILKAGVIGGMSQAGSYKLDCRFMKEDLIKKIEKIAKYRHRIHLYNLDAIDFIHQTNNFLTKNSFYCIDPPYYEKGSKLYANFYKPEDHKKLANVILGVKRPWILTYDDSPEIQKLYQKNSQFKFHLNYSAGGKRVGTELLITSKCIQIPNELELKTVA